MGNKSWGHGHWTGIKEGFKNGFEAGIEEANKNKLVDIAKGIAGGFLSGVGLATLLNESKQKKSIDVDNICPKCHISLISYTSKKGKLKYICSRCGSKFKV